MPDERLTTSVDCDYSARKDDIAAIAKTLNVKTWENKDGQPPSLAQFMLIDQDTHDIKRDDGRLFAVPDVPDEPNVVDIIDRPGGFDRSDFLGEKLYLHTAPFYVAGLDVFFWGSGVEPHTGGFHQRLYAMQLAQTRN